MCSTINLWETTKKKVKCRHYTEIQREQEVEEPPELIVTKPECFRNELIKDVLENRKTIDNASIGARAEERKPIVVCSKKSVLTGQGQTKS